MPLYSSQSDKIVNRYTNQQRVNGGRKRAGTAKRHPVYKIFLSHNDTVSLSPDYVHGRAGGLAKAHKRKESQT